MVFLAEKIVPISNQDFLSWIYDDPDYDQDNPVSITSPYRFYLHH